MMEILTLDELKARFKVSVRTIYAWRKLGMPFLRLPSTYAGKGKGQCTRYVYEDVLAWMMETSRYRRPAANQRKEVQDGLGGV